eukprot:CFRG1578T1
MAKTMTPAVARSSGRGVYPAMQQILPNHPINYIPELVDNNWNMNRRVGEHYRLLYVFVFTVIAYNTLSRYGYLELM